MKLDQHGSINNANDHHGRHHYRQQEPSATEKSHASVGKKRLTAAKAWEGTWEEGREIESPETAESGALVVLRGAGRGLCPQKLSASVGMVAEGSEGGGGGAGGVDGGYGVSEWGHCHDATPPALPSHHHPHHQESFPPSFPPQHADGSTPAPPASSSATHDDQLPFTTPSHSFSHTHTNYHNQHHHHHLDATSHQHPASAAAYHPHLAHDRSIPQQPETAPMSLGHPQQHFEMSWKEPKAHVTYENVPYADHAGSSPLHQQQHQHIRHAMVPPTTTTLPPLHQQPHQQRDQQEWRDASRVQAWVYQALLQRAGKGVCTCTTTTTTSSDASCYSPTAGACDFTSVTTATTTATTAAAATRSRRRHNTTSKSTASPPLRPRSPLSPSSSLSPITASPSPLPIPPASAFSCPIHSPLLPTTSTQQNHHRDDRYQHSYPTPTPTTTNATTATTTAAAATTTKKKRNRDSVRKHACSVCHRRFFRLEHVKRHLRLHTGDQPYSCETCGRKFARQDNCKLHSEKCSNAASRNTATSTTDGAGVVDGAGRGEGASDGGRRGLSSSSSPAMVRNGYTPESAKVTYET